MVENPLVNTIQRYNHPFHHPIAGCRFTTFVSWFITMTSKYAACLRPLGGKKKTDKYKEKMIKIKQLMQPKKILQTVFQTLCLLYENRSLLLPGIKNQASTGKLHFKNEGN